MGRKSMKSKPKRLDTIFLTGPGGMVYELPRDVAARHVLSMERWADMGDLPLVPYGHTVYAPVRRVTQRSAGQDVEGRQLAQGPGAGGPHTDCRYGTYLYVDGYYYTGYHYHPYGTELGYPC